MAKHRQMSSGVVIVPINAGSDGNPSAQPSAATYRHVDPPTLYLEKIGQLWMEARGEAQRGVTYRLDRLPHGYSMWERPRATSPKHVDKWLFGGPRGRFDSPNRFFPHFIHLMENGGSNIGCPCALCAGSKRILGGSVARPSRSASISTSASKVSPAAKSALPSSISFKPKGRPPRLDLGRTAQVDDEGTPDVYRNLFDELEKSGMIDEDITEKLSMDWRAERALTLEWLKIASSRPSWIPRIGDVVLFIRTLSPGEEIQYDESHDRFWIYNTRREAFMRAPTWEAGVISQSSHQDVSIPITDLVHEPEEQQWSVSYAGFRVEPLPELGSKDKTFSMRYKYVWLHHIRPFVFWKELLNDTPEDQWHPTIHNALTLMSTFSLVERFRFKGVWPSASVYFEGLYVGPELVLVGDTVRLLPNPADADDVRDVLRILSIQLCFTGLDQASKDDYDDGHPYNSTVFVYGTGYSWQGDKWVPKHDPKQQLKVSFSRILGRHFEEDAMALWFGQPPAGLSLTMSMSKGLQGIKSARKQARLKDARVQDGGLWYWAECRSDALDLRTFNGQEVAKFDPDRDPKEWRKTIKVMEGVAGERERMDIITKAQAQRALRKSIGMFAYNPKVDSDTDGLESRVHLRKRSRSAMDMDEDEDEDEEKDENGDNEPEQPRLRVGGQADGIAEDDDMDLDRAVDNAMEELSS